MSNSGNVGVITYDIELNVRRLIEGQQQVNDRMDRMERSADGASKSFSKLSGVAAALGGILSAKKIAEYAEAWTVLNNKLVNSIKIGENLAQVNERVFKIAQDSRSSIDGIGTLYSRLERATRDAGVSGKELAGITTTISKAMAVSGATASEAEGALIQLSQGLASGVLRGQEFNSMAEQAPALMKGLSDSLGVGIGELRKMAGQGELTTKVLIDAFKKMGPSIEKEFGKTVATIGQSLTVANNNITKFVGESSTVKSFVSVFNDSVVTLSANLDALSGVLTVAAAVVGSRYVGALAMATAAQVRKAMATREATIADAAAANQSALVAAAELRSAEAAKMSAIAELNKAEARVAGARNTGIATTAEIALADAEIASVRTSISLIESEKALEAQRHRSQIAEQGRIASFTRMAELQQASAVLTARLAQAEAAATAARTSSATASAAAITAAEARLSAARLAATTQTDSYNRSLAANAAAQTAAAAAARNANGAMSLARGALGLIGGPLGAAMLAGAAVLYFTQRAKEARDEANRLADSTTTLTQKFKEMSQAEISASIAKLRKGIPELTDSVKEAQEAFDKAKVANEAAAGALKRYGTDAKTTALYTDYLLVTQDNLAIASDNLSQAQNRLSRVNSTVSMGQAELNGGMRTGAELLSRNASEATVAGNAMNYLGKQIDFAARAKGNFNAESLKVDRPKDVQEYLDGQLKSIELNSELNDRKREQLKAEQDIIKAGGSEPDVTLARERAGIEYDAAEKRREARKNDKAAASEGASEAKKSISQLQELANQTEVLTLTEQRRYREAAQAESVFKLGQGATAAQIQEAKDAAGQEFDIKQRINDRKAASDTNYYAAANLKRQDDLDQTERMLAAELINFDQAQERKAQIAADYQKKIAEATAAKAVTPQQELKGMVDPVQELANEHAKKLALIAQFETEKGVITQRGLELMNAANTVYEQQRLAAAEQLYIQQSEMNAFLMGSVNALGGQMTNIISGMLTGTMSLREAMSNLASTILDQAVGALVQMGMQYVKNMMLEETLQNASRAGIVATAAVQNTAVATQTAASTAAAATTTAAWTPAAIMASIASMGTAAKIGLAAVAALGIYAVAGKRKNGGPVNAGGMYQVGEGGMPEIFQANNGRQYMIPGDNGNVVSNKDMQGAGSGEVSINVNVINQVANAQPEVQGYNSETRTVTLVIKEVANQLRNRTGEVSRGLEQGYNVSGKAQ